MLQNTRSVVLFTFSVFYGLIFAEQCLGMEHSCYITGDQMICYFFPNNKSVQANWDEAWDTCQKYNATLPTIPTEAHQDILTNHLRSKRITEAIWTAAHSVRLQIWQWTNGIPVAYSGLPQTGNQTQAVINSDREYAAANPIEPHNYVCQYPRSHETCGRSSSIQLKNGCVFLKSASNVTLFDARNDCLENGGDLPVLDDQENLERFVSIFPQLSASATLWTGLRKAWWTWNASDSVEEVKFTRWTKNHGSLERLKCAKIYGDSGEWHDSSCSNRNRLFICQIATLASERSLVTVSVTNVIVVVAVIVSIVIIAIVITVIVKKRRKIKKDGRGMRKQVTSGQYEELGFAKTAAKSEEPYNLGTYEEIESPPVKQEEQNHTENYEQFKLTQPPLEHEEQYRIESYEKLGLNQPPVEHEEQYRKGNYEKLGPHQPSVDCNNHYLALRQPEIIKGKERDVQLKQGVPDYDDSVPSSYLKLI